MAYLMGIDVGTSSLKTMVMDEYGKAISISSKEYDIVIPKQGYAEQEPAVWWDAAKCTINETISKSGVNPENIDCIGMSGQMHSIVLLDNNYDVIRPSIIWCDQRSAEQINELYKLMDKESLAKITLNPVAVGFSIVSLMWLRDRERNSFNSIDKFMLPKDYIRYKLTGEIGTEVSDASGTMLFNTKTMEWSDEILNTVEIDKKIMPKVGAPHEICGSVTGSAAEETGLRKGTPVVYGGGDQTMQAIGNGIIDNGTVSSTIGTGGQVFMKIDKPVYDVKLRTHTFCNAVDNTWNIIGGTLCAGLSLKWLKNLMLNDKTYTEISDEVHSIPPGSGGLVFLPYLIGERSPHMDPDARGMFFGLTLNHNRLNLARAVMEGVVFSLKDSVEILKELKLDINRIIASGGGAQSELWKQMQADIFGREIYSTNTTEHACTGAAIMAGLGCGTYKDIKEACSNVVSFDNKVAEPIKKNIGLYEELYGVYRSLYINNAELFRKVKTCERLLT